VWREEGGERGGRDAGVPECGSGLLAVWRLSVIMSLDMQCGDMCQHGRQRARGSKLATTKSYTKKVTAWLVAARSILLSSPSQNIAKPPAA
jgi:hypothetical protein